jgi:hypothetical protein
MRRTRASELVRRLVLASAVLTLAAPGVSRGANDGAAEAAAARDDKTAAGQKMKLNEVEIHGDLEKPKIFFILPKAKREADAKERRFRFYPDVLEPLDKDRFEEEARVLYQHGIPAE